MLRLAFSGRLQPLFSMALWIGRSQPFSIHYPHNRHLSAKVRACVNFLLGQSA